MIARESAAKVADWRTLESTLAVIRRAAEDGRLLLAHALVPFGMGPVTCLSEMRH